MPQRLVWFAIAVGVFVVDRFTKWMIERFMTMWDTRVVIPGFFQIIHTENRGAAFSLLANSSDEVRNFVLVGLSLLVLGFIAVLLWNSESRLAREHGTLRVGLALILGGALGNIYDRVTRGAVTDFLDVYAGDLHWPTFNAADCAISVGAGLMILSLWLGRREAART